MNRYWYAAIIAGMFLASLCPAQIDPNQKLQELRTKLRGSSASSSAIPSGRFLLPSSPLETSADADAVVGTSAILDKRIDPERYLLGPGDRLTAYMWGTTEKTLNLTVGSEGVILIPLIGEVDVRGLTLAQARTLLAEQLLRIYKNIKIAISLTSLRVFKTFITGDIENPGMYVVDGAARVSDLILLAGGTKTKLQRRGIQILQDSMVVGYADMALFENAGDMSGNPYLAEGQRVHITPRNSWVGVYGAVGYQNTYDFMDGDRLGNMIRAAGGLSREADSANIVLTRFTDNVDGLERIRLSLPADAAYPLKKDDRIIVGRIPEYRWHRNVSIEGEVKAPGTYPIQRDKTRLADVIDMAGGLTSLASPQGSFVVRSQFNRKSNEKADPQRMLQILETARVDPSTILPSDLSFIKAEYLETEGKLSLDFSRALSDRASPSNIILREGDQIFIARQELTVRVMGAVRSPGQVGLDGNRRAEYYIERAGGFNRNAKRYGVLLRKTGSDAWVKASGQKIEPGDVILVPEQRYRDAFSVTRDGLAIAASVATIIISAITIATYINPPQ